MLDLITSDKENMTLNDLKSFMLTYFPNKKWKIEIYDGYIHIKIKHAIEAQRVVSLYNEIPAGVGLAFSTMGFFESLFTRSGEIEIKK